MIINCISNFLCLFQFETMSGFRAVTKTMGRDHGRFGNQAYKILMEVLSFFVQAVEKHRNGSQLPQIFVFSFILLKIVDAQNFCWFSITLSEYRLIGSAPRSAFFSCQEACISLWRIRTIRGKSSERSFQISQLCFGCSISFHYLPLEKEQLSQKHSQIWFFIGRRVVQVMFASVMWNVLCGRSSVTACLIRIKGRP